MKGPVGDELDGNATNSQDYNGVAEPFEELACLVSSGCRAPREYLHTDEFMKHYVDSVWAVEFGVWLNVRVPCTYVTS